MTKQSWHNQDLSVLELQTPFTSFPALDHDQAPKSSSAMPPPPSLLTLRFLRSLALRPSPFKPRHHHPLLPPSTRVPPKSRPFSTTSPYNSTLTQLRRTARRPKPARRSLSPAMVGRPSMKGVCLKVGITKPKKPNSGQRKTAKVRLSSGKVVTAYIPGEGHNVQQHSVVMVRGGRSQDCPGVRYHLIRGAADLVSPLFFYLVSTWDV